MEDASLTASGMIVGTPHYMSPEQCAGRPLGPQSDQYSLAAVAFQMLTGSVPFDAESLPGVMQHHFFTPAPDMNAMRAGIPRELAAVVRRAMEKKPENRYATTRDMVDAIDAIPQSAEDRRRGEEMLRALAHGGALPHVQTTAAPTLTTSVAARDLRLSGILRMARGAGGRRGWVVGAVLGFVLVLLLAGGALAARSYFGPDGATRRAVRLYNSGQTAAARLAFTRLASDYPRRPVPRIYLGRIARESRQYVDAKREFEAAIQLEPGNPIAMREMGSLMYVTGRFDLAERFYRRALERAPNDALARGYLGCSLLRLGRVAEGQRLRQQAGAGSWNQCG
jgi:tetratricopeptide (TPR) repeat protein